VPEGEREPLPRDERHEPEEAVGGEGEDEGRGGEAGGEEEGDARQARLDPRRRADAREEEAAAEEAQAARGGDRLGVPPEDARGRDPPDGEERREGEEERDAEAEAEAAEERGGLPGVEASRREEVAVGRSDGRDEAERRGGPPRGT